MSNIDMNVAVSNTMQKHVETGDAKEHRTVRLSAKARDCLGYGLGDFVQLRDIFGSLICLRVEDAFEEDACTEEFPCLYVTKRNFGRAFIKDKCMGIRQVTDITLGCDPEAFLVAPNGNLVGAFRFFKKVGKVGHDGMLIEFRPDYSTSESAVTHNIHKLIQQAREGLNKSKEGREVRIISRSSIGRMTTGFHLHYGLPNRLLGFSSEVKDMAYVLTRAMDYYVGVPAIIPEGEDDSTRRTLPYVEYGKPGQFRLDGRTFEYRMPGGVNLKHPTLTRGLLALGAIVIEDMVSRIGEVTDSFSRLQVMTDEGQLRKIYPNLPDGHTMYAIVCNPSVELAKMHLETIKSDVRKMIGYKNKAESVEPYFACLDKDIKFNDNLEVNWGGLVNEEH